MSAAFDHKAIVLAHFGTTFAPALGALMNVARNVQTSFPGVALRTCFTSGRIREIWGRRRAEEKLWLDRGVPREILRVCDVVETLSKLREDGYREVLVQPTFLLRGEHYDELASAVRSLAPGLACLVVGQPLLAATDPSASKREIEETAEALRPDADAALRTRATLLYVGHGSGGYSASAFASLADAIETGHPGLSVHVGTLRSRPSIEDIIARFQRDPPQRVLLKPLLVSAGEHVRRDLFGDHDQSWRSRIEGLDVTVDRSNEGLGQKNAFARLYCQRIHEAAAAGGLELGGSASRV